MILGTTSHSQSLDTTRHSQSLNSDEQNDFKQKSGRELLRILGAIPDDLLIAISPESMKLKKFRKVPMVLNLYVASTMVGLDMMFFKFA